jgi:hypothetical protein
MHRFFFNPSLFLSGEGARLSGKGDFLSRRPKFASLAKP